MTASPEQRPRRGRLATPLARLAAFAVLLAVVAGVAALIGRASGLEVDETAPSAGRDADGGTGHSAESPAIPAGNGLSDSASALRLRIEPAKFSVGAPSRLKLSIVDRHGEPIGPLHAAHDEPPLHLILVRRDLAGYRHLHPKPSGGAYVVDLALPLPGIWRAYADFQFDGQQVVLGRDLFVPGDFVPQPLPAVASTGRAETYDVKLDNHEVRVGSETVLRFRIGRSGKPVKALQPYLGAAGHLVAIREDDLAYLHVHPLDSSGTGRIEFGADFAEPGRYALFLQFKHENRVRTTRFTVEVVP